MYLSRISCYLYNIFFHIFLYTYFSSNYFKFLPIISLSLYPIYPIFFVNIAHMNFQDECIKQILNFVQ